MTRRACAVGSPRIGRNMIRGRLSRREVSDQATVQMETPQLLQ